jgi:hypothetical protein
MTPRGPGDPKRIIDIATGETPDRDPTPEEGVKTPLRLSGSLLPRLTKPFLSRSAFKLTRYPPLDSENKKGTMFCIRSSSGRAAMLKIFVQEAAALASITLFVGMIAVWAQLITQF